ncbi:MAG TPA: polysaccharide biosynthesis tyrosine autokinase, partial [Actinomycetota bacterium]|nr:polysaccharide biosynthesis tyrosine autokinase [Actinomycetota bacterium]
FTEEIQRLQKPTQGEPAIQVRVVEPALRPEEPVSPSAVRNLALALVLGLLLGVGAVFLAESLDTTVKDRHDVERLVGAPVLATVPRIQTGGAEVYLERDPQSMGAEAFRKVRTAIQFLGVDRPIKVLLITSPFPREGKTTTALNLAASFAQAGMKTVLLEADLRRPTLHRVFASEQEKGLTTCLVGRISLQQAVLPTPVRNLSHIPAGAIPPNPAELLSSQHMGKVLSALQAEFDMVVVDAPPLLPVADTPALAHRVDGVLLVARAGQTNRERLRESAELLQTVGGRLLGVIVNFQRVEDSPEGYQYYGYRSSKQAFESPAGTGRAVAQKADRPPNGAVSERGRASKRA